MYTPKDVIALFAFVVKTAGCRFGGFGLEAKRPGISRNWTVDATYTKVKRERAYLYRAVDKRRDTIDFHLLATQDTKAAKRFLGKALNGLKDWQNLRNSTPTGPHPFPGYGIEKEGKSPENMLHRQVNYLNDVVEADHGKLKQLVKSIHEFKSMKTAYATIKGFEVTHALRKGQAALW